MLLTQQNVFLSLGDWGYDRRDWSTGLAGEWVRSSIPYSYCVAWNIQKGEITSVDSFTAEKQLQWKENRKFNSISLIMSIGAVQSPRYWPGKEYDDSLFKFSNSGDLWGTKRNGRSVFRNYSMLHEWCVNMHVYVSLKILDWVYSELPELSEEIPLKNSLHQFTELVELKPSISSATVIFLIVGHSRILHKDFDS